MIDMVLGVIILVSALLGLLRGFVAIVVGTLSWLLAGWATFMFGGAAAHWLADGKHPSATESFGGYAMVFVGVLISVALIGMVIRAGVEAIKLGGTDRMLGFVLGVVRGALLASVLVLLMGFTPLPREPAWRQSVLLPMLQPGAGWMRGQLPAWRMPSMEMPSMELGDLPTELGKLHSAGDNTDLGKALGGSGLRDTITRALGKPGKMARDGRDSTQAMPANIDPAQVRGGESDPARVESQGQARPPLQ
ncbi:CvpA family protein [Xanthomonas oryzae pv. oryzicola]|uniref:CvpA family protein n=1 Tax=Xanthomonas oryzae TaxID=347 RepID=UPI000654E16E|nr:CvpA family protein [Xanthomonas oryzae]AKO01720.1 colicin V synthesis protein [Xanthomonas oryzae pv. oryzicola]KOR48429.1 colicin V synthesis protein [Xanthomonas oryzae]OLK89113.1 colicin V synthesis protein [Xanthomonas oryzae pv. oryzicola]UNW41943.1 CvpA family protein [Xanthomonas oryzae pv. oryzicola]